MPIKRKPKKKKEKSKKDQSERFKDTARKLGVDESSKNFEKLFKKIVPTKN